MERAIWKDDDSSLLYFKLIFRVVGGQRDGGGAECIPHAGLLYRYLVFSISRGRLTSPLCHSHNQSIV